MAQQQRPQSVTGFPLVRSKCVNRSGLYYHRLAACILMIIIITFTICPCTFESSIAFRFCQSFTMIFQKGRLSTPVKCILCPEDFLAERERERKKNPTTLESSIAFRFCQSFAMIFQEGRLSTPVKCILVPEDFLAEREREKKKFQKWKPKIQNCLQLLEKLSPQDR